MPFLVRLGLHLGVVAAVGWAAILGGSFLRPVDAGPSPTRAELSPRLESPAVSSAAALSPLSISMATATPFAAADRPVPPLGIARVADPLRPSIDAELVALPKGPEGGHLAIGQEEGVVAVRSLSSRGGFRSPDPTATPAPTPTPTPAPTPKPPPPPKKEPLKPRTYKVVAGDTLLAIAARFGITPETVLWANDLGNGELLQIGQELTILPVSGVLHQVRKGDTMLGIADAYGADAAKIVEANFLSNPDQLQEGQELVIPDGMMRTVAVSGLPRAPSAQELASAPKYTVKAGDTLLSISDAFGVRASVIQVANGLLNPDMLKIGQVLSVPGGRQSAAARPQPAAPSPAAAPAAPAAPAGASTGDRIAAIAQQYLGYRYVWGGHSPSGFDCSGFTWYVYKQAGVGIPLHDLWGQLGTGPRISRGNLLPGDLVFFENTYQPGLSHTGIYLGGGRWINAEDEAVGVQIRSLSDRFWAARYVGASRPW